MRIRAKVLVVEDEAIVARDTAESLRSWGYEVSASARSGEEALEAVARNRPDLALMDIRLPGELDGIQTAEEMDRRLAVPVVYLTSQVAEGPITRERRRGQWDMCSSRIWIRSFRQRPRLAVPGRDGTSPAKSP